MEVKTGGRIERPIDRMERLVGRMEQRTNSRKERTGNRSIGRLESTIPLCRNARGSKYRIG